MTLDDLIKEISTTRSAYHDKLQRYERMKVKKKRGNWSDDDEINLYDLHSSILELKHYQKGLERGLKYVEALTK